MPSRRCYSRFSRYDRSEQGSKLLCGLRVHRLRLGIDGLAAIITQQFGGYLSEESLFLFCGRRADRMKALYWSGEGYVLLYKGLSNGRFQWLRSEIELRLLDPQSFRWLMEGLKVEQKTAIRRYRQLYL